MANLIERVGVAAATDDAKRYSQSIGAALIDSARISVMAATGLIPPEPPLLLTVESDPPTIHDCLDQAMRWLDAARVRSIELGMTDVTSLHSVSMGDRSILDSTRCRVCGCTDDRACVTRDGPCHWVDFNLCSACVPITEARP